MWQAVSEYVHPDVQTRKGSCFYLGVEKPFENLWKPTKLLWPHCRREPSSSVSLSTTNIRCRPSDLLVHGHHALSLHPRSFLSLWATCSERYFQNIRNQPEHLIAKPSLTFQSRELTFQFVYRPYLCFSLPSPSVHHPKNIVRHELCLRTGGVTPDVMLYC